jgi:outer membrane protein OmpA-like peptidoglycan-associated protein
MKARQARSTVGRSAGRPRRLARLVLVAAVGLPAGTAWAQASGFEGERLAPAAGAAGGVFVERPVVPFHLGYGLGFFLHFADDAVVVRDAATGAVVGRPLDGAVSMDFLASIGLFDRLELALALPVRIYYAGDTSAAPLVASRGVGDLRLVPKVSIAQGGRGDLWWAFGAAAPVTFPTGDDLALRGAAGVTVEPRLLFGVYPGRLAVVANAGFLFRRNASFSPGDALTFGVATDYTLPAANDLLDLHAEISWAWLPSVNGRALLDLPLEAVAGLIAKPHPRWSIYAMGGLGITNGLAVPDFRVLGGVRYAVGLPGKGGERDSDSDGIVDSQDRCADQPEDRDGFEDQDGCPDPDNDKDGIPDDVDECPEDAEEPGGDGDGCPDKARVTVRGGKLIIFGKVQFALGSDAILPKSEQLVDAMAQALKEHPELKKVEIQGHTDSLGDDFYNLKLGQERAESVKRALVKRGVAPVRLTAKGYGEGNPIAPNDTPAGRAKNRRVEFVIVN